MEKNKMKTSTEPYISTYLHAKGRKLGLPIAGNFELTARCNFNCPMCYVHLSEEQVKASGKELSAAQWLKIAEDAKDQGMVFALLTGGEPLVRKDFFEIYNGMKEMGLMISINSNGSMLQGEILEKFLKEPPTRFNISLYGGSNDAYEKMCGRPVYDQVKANIRALRSAGVDVSLNLSITPYNRNELERIYADALELDVNVRATSYMFPSVRKNGEQFGCGNRLSPAEAAGCSVKWDELRLDDEEFRMRAGNMLKRINEHKEGCPAEAGEGISCRAGSSSFWVTWDGKMLPCGMMTTPEVDLLEDGFETAWKKLREETAKIHMPPKCGTCEYKELCGACAAMCLTETGRFDGVPVYVCEKIREQVKMTQEVCEKRK